MIVFDIETGPLPSEHLAKVMPEFRAPANYKDQTKIEAYVSESRELWRQNAALSALTGRVLAIGVSMDGETKVIGLEDESETINWFWLQWQDARMTRGNEKFVGFCVKPFDLPFLVQRSWIHGVHVPFDVFEGRYWNSAFIDLQERWLCGGRDSRGASLDAVCRAFGLEGKHGTGADFARLWESDRYAAFAYLKHDLWLTRQLAERMGVS